MRSSPACGLLLAVALAACQAGGPDLAAERRAIDSTDQAWMAAAAGKDLEKIVSFWTDDATLLPPDMPALKGKAAIREYIAAGLQAPGFSVSWTTLEITVAPDGRTAYQLASNQFTAQDSTGALQTMKGKAVVLWRKEPDGAWRSVVEIWNRAGK